MIQGLIIGIASALAFLIFLLALQLPFWLAVLLGAATYLAFTLLLGRQRQVEVQLGALNAQEVQKTLEEGSNKVKEISAYGLRLPPGKIRNKIERICQIAEEILEAIEKNPQDFKAAKRFFSYYLETTLKIVKTYADLSKQAKAIPEAQETLQKAEAILDNIEKTFQKQLSRILEDDLLDLDAEISLLEKTIKMEGL